MRANTCHFDASAVCVEGSRKTNMQIGPEFLFLAVLNSMLTDSLALIAARDLHVIFFVHGLILEHFMQKAP
jgi:hypothetical protein